MKHFQYILLLAFFRGLCWCFGISRRNIHITVPIFWIWRSVFLRTADLELKFFKKKTWTTCSFVHKYARFSFQIKSTTSQFLFIIIIEFNTFKMNKITETLNLRCLSFQIFHILTNHKPIKIEVLWKIQTLPFYIVLLI